MRYDLGTQIFSLRDLLSQDLTSLVGSLQPVFPSLAEIVRGRQRKRPGLALLGGFFGRTLSFRLCIWPVLPAFQFGCPCHQVCFCTPALGPSTVWHLPFVSSLCAPETHFPVDIQPVFVSKR